MLLLNAPARPRSPVATTIKCVSFLPVPASSFGLCGPTATLLASEETTSAMRVEKEAGSHGVAVRWRPFLLGPIFRTQGWLDSPFNIYPVKGRYMWRDLARICAADVP